MELMDNLGLDGLDIDWVSYCCVESDDSRQEENKVKLSQTNANACVMSIRVGVPQDSKGCSQLCLASS